MAMLVLAIVAVGTVSAAENVTADIDEEPVDDIAIDDVSTDVADEEPLRTSYDVDPSMDSSTINSVITIASTTTHVVNFEPGNYTGMSLTVQNNTVLNGNGAKLTGDGVNDVFLVTQKSNFTIMNFIIDINKTTKGHGIYGHHVYNSTITNNTIINGEDAINIYQVHENLTITGNTIYNVTQDGISLVNFNTYNDTAFENFVGSTVSGNNITGCQYGMFFGGNFKGTISNNKITNCDYGMQFKGKKSDSNGRLNAIIFSNVITGVTTGIDMSNPSVNYLYMYLNTIITSNSSSNFAISNNTHFAKEANGHINILLNILNGNIYQSFINKTDIFVGNYGYNIV